MHVAIARAAEEHDWLASGSHYSRGGAPDDAMRVLGAAAYKALGTGAWGAATAVVASTPGVVPPPAVEVIRARSLIADGRAPEALDVLASLEAHVHNESDLAILRLTRANGLHITGEHDELVRQLGLVIEGQSTPVLAKRIAHSWLQMLFANRGGSIPAAAQSMQDLAQDVTSQGLFYFAGVALHNAAGALLAMGRFEEASVSAANALAFLGKSSTRVAFVSSTRMIIAHAAFETGQLDRSLQLAQEISNSPSVTSDALAEGGYLAALMGRRELADTWLGQYMSRAVPGLTEPGAQFQALQGRLALAISRGDWPATRSLIGKSKTLATVEIDGLSRVALADAITAAATWQSDAVERAERALTLIERQGSWRWGTRARIVDAVARRSRDLVDGHCREAAKGSVASLLETAPAIVESLDLFDEAPEWLLDAVLSTPSHWLPILRRRVEAPSSRSAYVAASLIAEFGVMEDAGRLKDFEQRDSASRRRRGLVARLTRRISPTVRVHDLGLVTCDIGPRSIELSEARRRAAALLLYLISRSGQSAVRDLVMEDLWPDQPPQSALNSLHQTLFFLRRLLEPWQEDGISSAYVRMEADIVLLNQDLFQIDSVAFQRQATSIMGSRQCAELGPSILRLYSGTFAPEFEYEPWAEDWRTHVHATYLRLADATTRELLDRRDIDEATDLLAQVVTLDPSALELRGRLVSCLALLGSKDAAAAQYRGLVAAYERELGEPPPTYTELTKEQRDL